MDFLDCDDCDIELDEDGLFVFHLLAANVFLSEKTQNNFDIQSALYTGLQKFSQLKKMTTGLDHFINNLDTFHQSIIAQQPLSGNNDSMYELECQLYSQISSKSIDWLAGNFYPQNSF